MAVLIVVLVSDKFDALGLVLAAVMVFFACWYLILAVNLLRLRRWAIVAVRIMLITGIVLASGPFVFKLTQGLDFFDIINVLVAIVWCAFLFAYLGRQSHLLSNTASGMVTDKVFRTCPHCGNEDLTSFDRVCQKCKKALEEKADSVKDSS